MTLETVFLIKSSKLRLLPDRLSDLSSLLQSLTSQINRSHFSATFTQTEQNDTKHNVCYQVSNNVGHALPRQQQAFELL